ncbi:MAG: DUF1989 domain-containing protein [Chloroflexota bacterium]
MTTAVLTNPYTLGNITTPGVPFLPAGQERYPIEGGNIRFVEIFSGDELILEDREGLQPCEISAIDANGTFDAGLIGAGNNCDAEGIRQILQRKGDNSLFMRTLDKLGIDVRTLKALRIFEHESPIGNTASFVASGNGHLIVAAIGEDMSAHSQDAPTEIVLTIKRATVDENQVIKPADPLADPLQDINIQPGFAKAYVVKAGQYIQIMDVQGRECSDFQAYDLAALEKGREFDIDPTTTRSLMGALWPGPGLYSKFYTVQQKPLVEIIRDTVGRHDTFGLACSARYYDDMGYPGHLNCSDNLNLEAKPYTISYREGWPAINFFFNTMTDETNGIGMDDPWSRPGDYVLMQALTDLVCFSTGCPCDVDPANGWNPTDIQVRVYDKKELFSKSFAFRKTASDDMQLTQETAFHPFFSQHTRKFSEYHGYWLADEYNNYGAIAEYTACREKAVVMDLSPLRKFEVLGPDAEALTQLCLTRNVRKLSVGQVSYTAMCYEHGGMIDDGTIFRLGENNFRWIGGSDASGIWMREQAQKRNMNAWVKSSTAHMHNVAVQGPKSRDILRKILWMSPSQPNIDELKWFRFAVARLNDFDGIPLVVSRTGYSGELGFEIFCHPKDAQELADAVWAAGEPEGMLPLGLNALDMIRIEAGLVFAATEFCDQTDPFEAGIGFTVPLKSKEDDFIGKDALIERKAHPHRKLVGLEIDAELVPQQGDGVYIGRAQVGEITSAMRSPILRKVIAFCRMNITHSALDTQVEVGQLDGYQKRIPAKVVKFPFYDPEKTRVRS